MGFWFTSIQDSFTNKRGYVALEEPCAGVRKDNQRLNGEQSEEVSQPILEAIGQLTT